MNNEKLKISMLQERFEPTLICLLVKRVNHYATKVHMSDESHSTNLVQIE